MNSGRSPVSFCSGAICASGVSVAAGSMVGVVIEAAVACTEVFVGSIVAVCVLKAISEATGVSSASVAAASAVRWLFATAVSSSMRVAVAPASNPGVKVSVGVNVSASAGGICVAEACIVRVGVGLELAVGISEGSALAVTAASLVADGGGKVRVTGRSVLVAVFVSVDVCAGGSSVSLAVGLEVTVLVCVGESVAVRVGVCVRVFVADGVEVARVATSAIALVRDGGCVGVSVAAVVGSGVALAVNGVALGSDVCVDVKVSVAVKVALGVIVKVFVADGVKVCVRVFVGVNDGVNVFVAVSVTVAVLVDVAVLVGVKVRVGRSVRVKVAVWVKVALGVKASSTSTGKDARSSVQKTSGREIHAKLSSSRWIRIQPVAASLPTGTTISPPLRLSRIGYCIPGPARRYAPRSPARTQFPSGVSVGTKAVGSSVPGTGVGVRSVSSNWGRASTLIDQYARSRRIQPKPRL